MNSGSMKRGKMKPIIKCRFLLFGCLGLCLGYLFPISVSAQPCKEWAGKIVSAQGTVEGRKAGEADCRIPGSAALASFLDHPEHARRKRRDRATTAEITVIFNTWDNAHESLSD